MSKLGVSPFRYVSVDELMSFYMCSLNTAKQRKAEISKKYGKKSISYYDLAKYEGYDVGYILSFFYG